MEGGGGDIRISEQKWHFSLQLCVIERVPEPSREFSQKLKINTISCTPEGIANVNALSHNNTPSG